MSVCDSRAGFCLWSAGDNLQLAIEDNHRNYLDAVWKTEHFFVVDTTSTQAGGGSRSFSLCRLLWSALAYPVGMVSYLIDTVVKVVLLIGNLLFFLLSLFCYCNTHWHAERVFEKRSLLLLDTLAAIGIGLIGSAIPPLGYKLDAWAQESFKQWAAGL